MQPPAPYTNGCVPFSQPIPENWIALVERGSCSFLDKVRALQTSGAVAVIIGDRHYNGWVTMYAAGDASDIVIPSVYVAQQQFLALLNHKQVQIRLTSNGSWTWSMADILLFLAILIPSTVLYALYITWRVNHQRQSQLLLQQQLQQQRQANRHRTRAPANLVHRLPVRAFHHDKKEKQEIAECIICLEEYEEGDFIKLLPCIHEFHQACIDTWLITRNKFVSLFFFFFFFFFFSC
jgi:hypothetical protein